VLILYIVKEFCVTAACYRKIKREIWQKTVKFRKKTAKLPYSKKATHQLIFDIASKFLPDQFSVILDEHFTRDYLEYLKF